MRFFTYLVVHQSRLQSPNLDYSITFLQIKVKLSCLYLRFWGLSEGVWDLVFPSVVGVLP